MKTPEEIKRGLECCLDDCDRVGNCPYSGTFGCDECLKRDAIAFIEQLESQIPRWIPVEERLPEIGVNVLLLHPHMCEWDDSLPTVEVIVVTGRLCTAHGFKKKKAWIVHRKVFDIGEECNLNYATHWMTIPTLPEPLTKDAETHG